jgi:hypothetical protein
MTCWFCNSNNHDITRCHDPMISVIYQRIKITYVNGMNEYPSTIEMYFKSTLNRLFELRELKVICVIYLNVYLNAITIISKAYLIEMIWEYFRIRIYQIPAFANDLVQSTLQEPESDSINFYIDTAPEPMLSMTLTNYNELDRSEYLLEFNHRTQIHHQENIDGVSNLNHEIDIISNIHHSALPIKKYDIFPRLVQEEIEEGEQECAICYENINCIDLVSLNCKHKFCSHCIKGILNTHNNIYYRPACALCREPIMSFSVTNPEIYTLVSEHCNL